MIIDSVVTYHPSVWTCGVTRWNARLARELNVPLRHLVTLSGSGRPYHQSSAPIWSLKRAEIPPEIRHDLFRDIDDTRLLDHTTDGLIWSGRPLWCPSTIHALPREVLTDDYCSVLCFGMGHKIQAGPFRRLREVLEQTGRPYRLSVSTAIHTGASLDDFAPSYEAIAELFSRRTQFLGWLADAAIATVLSQAHLFAALFPQGVRANNTTVMAAMAAGCPVLTTLDAKSPEGFVHGETVLDLAHTLHLPAPHVLEQIGRRAQAMVNERYSWDRLIAVLQEG